MGFNRRSAAFGAARHGSSFRGGIGGGAAAIWTPAQLTNIEHWYRADLGTIISGAYSATPDRVGTSDATQATSTARPSEATANGRDAYGCVDAHYLATAQFTDIPQPFTVIGAVMLDDAADISTFSGGGVNGTSRWFLRFNGGTSVELFAGTLAAVTYSYTTATKYTLVAVFNGASSKLRINGTSVTTTASVGTALCHDMAIGRENDTVSSRWMHGRINESGIVSGDLTANATELARLEDYYGSHYA